MNKRNVQPGFVFRVAILTLAIALIFGSMAVFHAESEGAADPGDTTISSQEGEETTASSQEGGETTASSQEGEETTASSQEGEETTASSQEGEETTASSQEGEETTASSQDGEETTASSQDGEETTASSQDGGETTASSQEGEETTASSQEGEETTSTTSTTQPTPVCKYCGEPLDELSGECLGAACHAHNGELGCETCADCGGCVDAMYGSGCYKADGTKCTPCSCFYLSTKYVYPSTVISPEKAEKLTADKGYLEINLGRDVIVKFDDGSMSLNQAISGEGAKITSLTAKADPIKSSYPNNRVLTTYKEIIGGVHSYTPVINVDYPCVEGGKNGDSCPIDVQMTVTRNGVSRTISFTYLVEISGADYIKSVKLVKGSEDFELEMGDAAEVQYQVVYADGYSGPFHISGVEFEGDKYVELNDIGENIDKGLIDLSFNGIAEGTATLKLYIAEGDGTNKPTDEVVRTIKIKCVGVKAPGGSVLFSDASIETDESTVLKAKGWHDKANLADSRECYLPYSWRVGSENGTWGQPKKLTDAAMANYLTSQPVNLDGLAAKKYTATVTYQRYVRGEDGTWSLVAGETAVGSATLNVVADTADKPSAGTDTDKDDTGKDKDNNKKPTGGNKKPTGGGSPDTGDITVKDTTNVSTAGTVMLIAGLCILGALAGERVYRVFAARKRQASAIRR